MGWPFGLVGDDLQLVPIPQNEISLIEVGGRSPTGGDADRGGDSSGAGQGHVAVGIADRHDLVRSKANLLTEGQHRSGVGFGRGPIAAAPGTEAVAQVVGLEPVRDRLLPIGGEDRQGQSGLGQAIERREAAGHQGRLAGLAGLGGELGIGLVEGGANEAAGGRPVIALGGDIGGGGDFVFLARADRDQSSAVELRPRGRSAQAKEEGDRLANAGDPSIEHGGTGQDQPGQIILGLGQGAILVEDDRPNPLKSSSHRHQGRHIARVLLPNWPDDPQNPIIHKKRRTQSSGPPSFD
jgi:hypothetical protein